MNLFKFLKCWWNGRHYPISGFYMKNGICYGSWVCINCGKKL